MVDHWSKRYIGLPWEKGSRGPHSFDCWGLAVDVFINRLGIDLDMHPVDPFDKAAVKSEISAELSTGSFKPVEGSLCEYDCLLMGKQNGWQHVGIWIEADGGLCLHASPLHGVTVATLPKLMRQGYKSFTFYRHADNC